MTKELIQKYADIESPKTQKNNMNDYYVKSTFDVIELQDGTLVAFDKQSIKREFCFSDEGLEYDEYKKINSNDEIMKKYFFNENLKEINEQIEMIKNNNDSRRFFGLSKNDKVAHISFRCYSNISNNFLVLEGLREHELDKNFYAFEILPEEYKTQCLEVLERQKESLLKRLNTWWKRYGSKNIRTWTYWADR